MATGKIIIIEDEEENREILAIHLRRAGYQVIETMNGKQAKEEMDGCDEQSPVNLIITDIRMPEVNGVEVVDYVNKNFPDIPVIFVTGFADNELSDQLVEKGVKSVLVKPVEKNFLLKAVAEAMA
jgi:two-component system cell cycle sensor histidine kinase/response regulator CckA